MSAEIVGPSLPKEEQRLRLLTEEEFPAESLGRGYARGLEGREREMAVVLQGVERLFGPLRLRKTVAELKLAGFNRIFDILSLSPQELQAWIWGERIRNLLDNFFENLKISQDQWLLKAIFGKDCVPRSLTPQKEKEVHEAVVEAINTLKPRHAEILKSRFGITDGVSHTLEQTGREFGVGKERISQVETESLRILRHPSRSKKLREYLPLHPNSVAYSIAGLTEILKGDLKPLAGVPLSKLSPGIEGLVRYVGEKSGMGWFDVSTLLRSDSDLFWENLSPGQIEDLKEGLLSVYKMARQGEFAFIKEEVGKQKVCVNNLFPEIEISDKVLGEIGKISILELTSRLNFPSIRIENALKRAAFKTLGEVLEMTGWEFLERRNLGITSLSRLKEALRAYIKKVTTTSPPPLLLF